jgi:hypothetical protein
MPLGLCALSEMQQLYWGDLFGHSHDSKPSNELETYVEPMHLMCFLDILKQWQKQVRGICPIDHLIG